METFKVNTGYGYIKDSEGNIVSKYELPKGEHPAREGYEFIEVPSKEELNEVSVYTPPDRVESIATRERRKLIMDKMEELAIAALIKEGKL